jgi:hypothetical protein
MIALPLPITTAAFFVPLGAAGMRQPRSKRFLSGKRSLGPHSPDPKALAFASTPQHASAQSRRDSYGESRALDETRSAESISE